MKPTVLPFVVATCVFCCAGARAQTAASAVTISQPANSRLIRVAYTAGEAGVMTFQFKTNGVPMSHNGIVKTLRGDANTAVAAGAHAFDWDAGRDFPEQVMPSLSVDVTIWPANSPPLFVAACTRWRFADADDPKTKIRFYASEDELPEAIGSYGTGGDRWRLDWMLLKQIPATNGVWLGSPSTEWGRNAAREVRRQVNITQPFYVGIYEVTQRQWAGVKRPLPGGYYGDQAYPSNACRDPFTRDFRPVADVSYYSIRGNDKPADETFNNRPGEAINWPLTGHAVAPRSFFGEMRANTGGLLEFDLPTEAQWEYACRAGTDTAWNNGTDGNNQIVGDGRIARDSDYDLLGRSAFNGGLLWDGQGYSSGNYSFASEDCGPENRSAIVGSYQPNAFGLYDMHGNAMERCLDWKADYDEETMGGTDPEGPASSGSNQRAARGAGSWSNYWYDDLRLHRSASRDGFGYDPAFTPDGAYANVGFRVVAPACVILQ